MNVLIDGTVPKSAGLSSSSALVCCAALATAFANNKKFTKVRFKSLCCRTEFNTTSICANIHLKCVKKFWNFQLELAEICQRCERYIGTEGGGMDQAIAYLAEAGTVSCIRVTTTL